MTLIEVLISAGVAAISTQRGDGSMPPGHNGPYRDPETPVRNTSHWLIAFARLHGMTGEQTFADAASRAANYLRRDPMVRPYGWSFHHRTKPGKDTCNGLIGQAWTFEALASATELTGDPSYAQLAEEVFFQHSFDPTVGLWHRLEIDGTCLPIDPTFNHQLWFAACAATIQGAGRADLLTRVRRFLDECAGNVEILKDGLIFHPVQRPLADRAWRRMAQRANRTLGRGVGWYGLRGGSKQFEELRVKSIGYHAFNMYAFALLKPSAPDHSWWSSAEFRRTVEYLRSESYRREIGQSPYGYAYNPPGFEVPFALQSLSPLSMEETLASARYWLREQHARYWPWSHAPARAAEDTVTQAARIYECTRMPKSILDSVEIPDASATNYATL